MRRIVMVLAVVFFLSCGNVASANPDIKLGGVLEADAISSRYNGQSESNFRLNKAEIGLDAEFRSDIFARIAVEYCDPNGTKYKNDGGEFELSEASVLFSNLVYDQIGIKAGKWEMFPCDPKEGEPEKYLVFDSLTRDKYEINSIGASIEIAPESEFSFSAAGYANDGSLFADANRQDIGNYILKLGWQPGICFEAKIIFDSEKGRWGWRNDTLGGNISAVYYDIAFSASYFTATQRECCLPKERIFSSSAMYQFLPGWHLTGFYEKYWDGVKGEQPYNSETLTGLDFRAGWGASWEINEYISILGEYRYSKFEEDKCCPPDMQEIGGRLRLSF